MSDSASTTSAAVAEKYSELNFIPADQDSLSQLIDTAREVIYYGLLKNGGPGVA